MCREEQLKYHMSPRDHFSAQDCSRALGLGNLPCKAQNEVRVRLNEAQNENVQSEAPYQKNSFKCEVIGNCILRKEVTTPMLFSREFSSLQVNLTIFFSFHL